MVEGQNNSPGLLTDLASAYVQRADSSDRAVDYGNAVEALGKALTKSPDDPVALFNRAIVSERLLLYAQAIADWEHYLKVDSHSGWAEEARQRLARLRDKLQKHARSVQEPLLDPKTFVEKLRGDPLFAAATDARIEEYLNLATARWLPAAYSPSFENPTQEQQDVRTALGKLAELLAQRHGDLWLKDILDANLLPGFATSFTDLGEAVTANAAGDVSRGANLAERAERSFRRLRSISGQARARMEKVYALHRLAQGDRCLKASKLLEAQLLGRSYTWLDSQMLLEESSCWGMVGNLGMSQKLAERALRGSRAAGYGILYLRSLGFVASSDTDEGNLQGSWARNLAGLQAYWGGVYPPVRAYQFYSELVFVAEDSEQWTLALPLAREAVAAVMATENRTVEAWSHYKLASIATAAGARSEAAKEFDLANQLFAGLRQTPDIQVYKIDGEISMASLEALRGENQHSLARLSSIRQRLPGVANYPILWKFYQTLADVYLQQARYTDADQAFRSAVAMSERGLGSLRSDDDRLAWHRDVSKTYRRLVWEKLVHDEQPTEALELWEWYRGMPVRTKRREGQAKNDYAFTSTDLRNLDAGPALPQVHLVSQLLQSLTNETVLSFAQFPDGLAIWAFDDRGVESRWVPASEEEIGQLANRFREECTDPASDFDALHKDGRRLFDLLIAPIATRLTPGRTLVVEPDGVVSKVPIEALLDTSDNYLALRFNIVVSPGIEYERRLHDGADDFENARAVVVGTPAVGRGLATSFPPLPDATREAEIVAAHFHNAKLLLGASATLDAVERALRNASVFHFAGHAISSTKVTGLLLTSTTGLQQGMETASLLGSTQLQRSTLRSCRLAVLSACATATSDDLAWPSPDNLVGAFLRGGVPHVVASLWQVDSTSTATFMNLFYQALLSDNSVPRAVQKAASGIREQPQTAHPYYWAAFTVFGRS
jgi:CHAT domain-containing protein